MGIQSSILFKNLVKSRLNSFANGETFKIIKTKILKVSR